MKQPLFTASQSLNVSYHFENNKYENADVFSSGNDIHARMKAGYDGMRQARKDLNYTPSLDKINIATAAVTLLYTDTSPEEGYLSEEVFAKTFALNSLEPSKRLVSVMDLYHEKTVYRAKDVKGENKSKRDYTFNSLLQDRIENFSQKDVIVKYNYSKGKSVIDSGQLLKEQINNSQFHETFHHSEQTVMHEISSPLGLVALVNTLLESKASYFYGMLLDLYTERVLCTNCNIGLLGLQHSQKSGFLNELGLKLEKKGIQPRLENSMMLHTRVSATKAKGDTFNKMPNNKGSTIYYDPDSCNEILQANNKTLGVVSRINKNNYDLSSYPGGFFFSTQQKNQKNLVKYINKINPNIKNLLVEMK